MAVEKIGVIGAGQMGTGISHVLALAGYQIMLDDVNKDALGKALARIEKNMQRQAAKGTIAEDAIKPAMAPHQDDPVAGVTSRTRDLVIEAATEDEPIKKKIFQDLCTRISDRTILATNTSSISGDPAGVGDRPAGEIHIGLHFHEIRCRSCSWSR